MGNAWGKIARLVGAGVLAWSALWAFAACEPTPGIEQDEPSVIAPSAMPAAPGEAAILRAAPAEESNVRSPVRLAPARRTLRGAGDVAGYHLLLDSLESPFERRHPSLDLQRRLLEEPQLVPLVLQGTLDFAAIGRPLRHRERRTGLEAHEIARVPMVAIVHPRNPVTDVQKTQLGELLAGNPELWRAISRQDGPLRIAAVGGDPLLGLAMRQLFPGRLLAPELTRQTHAAVVDLISRSPDALGFVPLTAIAQEKVRLLTVDGVQPNVHQARAGHYPVVCRLWVVTRQRPSADVLRFVAFAQSTEGRRSLTHPTAW